MQPIINYIKHPASFLDSLVHNFGQWLPDSTYIKLRYRFLMGKKLNLKEPQTFQEKLQWLKLYDHNPLYTTLVDKILVKDYVASKVGEKYVIPLLAVWDKPEDIEWDLLPKKFVLKTNHGGGNSGVLVCRDKSLFDKAKAIRKLNDSLRSDIYQNRREWPYKNVKKKIFAEELIETTFDDVDLPDYKWYCFNGEPKYCQLIQNRSTNETIDFFDIEWNRQEFIGMNPAAEHAYLPIARPVNLDTHLRIARELSRGIPFVRIDLYDAIDRIFFGEITFYPASGFGNFSPDKYNLLLGQMLLLPTDSISC